MSLADTIRKNTNARGLAIVITNDYDSKQTKLGSGCTRLHHLPGTTVDGRNMKDAFESLHFVVHWEQNIGIEKFDELIYEAKMFQGYGRLKRYKCIVFVFSGHGNSGDSGDFVFLQDGQQVPIKEKIIEPFLPKSSPNMGKFQKLFFIDACRGDQEMKGVLVPKSGQARGSCDSETKAEHRGASMMKALVPPEGGFLVAYSTMSNYRAWENKDRGGAWLELLARKIKVSLKSIDDVLTEVNNELTSDPKQQPEKWSRLNQVICLHPDADEPVVKRSKPVIAAVFPSQAPTGSPIPSQDLQLLNAPDELTSQVAVKLCSDIQETRQDDPIYVKQLTSQFPALFYDHPHTPPEYNGVTFYRSQVRVTCDHLTLIGDSQKYFVDVRLSRDEAAKDALSKLVGSGNSQAAVGASGCPEIGDSSHTISGCTETSQLGLSRSLNSVPGSNYKEQMQIFFQRNKINPQFEFQSDNATGSTRHRCLVRYTVDGRQKRVDSGHFFLKKADAKEQVAKLVLSQESVTQATSKGSSPPLKMWKSKLKEYCDKHKQVVDLQPSYTTFPSGNRGFVSTVSFLGMEIQGDICKSKQEAEHSAACHALKSVQTSCSISK